jgi:hypothetical protein
MTLTDLETAIRAAWSRDTSDDPHEWTPDWASRGQCGATALVLRELLGGDILIAEVLLDGEPIERHAWNRLPSGLELDLTREQFRRGETLGEPVVAEPLARTRTLADVLGPRVRERLPRAA